MGRSNIYRISLVPLALLLLAGMVPPAWGQEASSLVTAEENSRIYIEGRSNLHPFQCNAEEYEGHADLDGRADEIPLSRLSDHLILEIRIPVRSLECGKRRMNRDLYDALRSDHYRHITFNYIRSRRLPGNPAGESPYLIEVSGILSVAGTAREITFTAEGWLLEENRIRLKGSKEIRMTDYNVGPPTGLLGLIRADNELTVHFDLYALAKPGLLAETIR